MSETTMPDAPVLQAQGLSKVYLDAGAPLTILEGVDLSVQAGERVAIVGASGSGKSTLLHLLGGLDRPSSGEVRWSGQTVFALDEAARGRLRNAMLGFVYQFHHLLPEFTALENVALPWMIRRRPKAEALERARALLCEVGLEARLAHFPSQLSGGERQRVAIARALVTEPLCLLADEPTGNLDRTNAERVFELLLSLTHTRGMALVVVTHDERLAARLDRRLVLEAGRLYESG
ncbi:ABC transporter ATP-binding protein [Tepidiphilus margaritifer]|uniref:ABC transporter ATP-binding protein n=1 Tax=Tepidiphilus margaritifer TaxID=203471 RepID=UPI0004059672|nr:ABC transporter ATP-binding protein [Tepidiphilus margaritifer]